MPTRGKSPAPSKTKVRPKASAQNTTPAGAKNPSSGPKPGPGTKPATGAGAKNTKKVPSTHKSKVVPGEKGTSPAPLRRAPSKAKVVGAKKAPSTHDPSPTTPSAPETAAGRSGTRIKKRRSARSVRFSPSTSGEKTEEGAVPDLNTDFRSTFKTLANKMYPAQKYVSQATGMEVLHVEVPGPVLNAYLVLGKKAGEGAVCVLTPS